MSDAKALVQEFCDRMAHRDAEALRGFLADDAIYQNVGMPASVGVDAIIANLAGQIGMFPDSYAYEMKNIAANGDVVLTERLDYVNVPGGKPVGVPVMGTFVVRNGKIARWRDYFDLGLPGKMLSGADVSGLVPQQY
ncbi:MAG: limonene-1,2-epoxide hydrolase family protein [Actinomycetota bacterium]|nr:limonene-1,2-epoxide hydrolase family protein [Actinomycetota bacterium]